MKLADIQKKAKALDMVPDKKMSKTDLIRAIQTREGNTPCFATAVADCPHSDCCWRPDCLKC